MATARKRAGWRNRPTQGTQPSGGGHGEAVEGVVRRLPDDLDPVERADRGEHMRRVGALPPPGIEQLPRLAPDQQRLEQQTVSFARDQAAAERAQGLGVEARIVQLQPQDVLPIQAGTHGVGRPAIGQALRELQGRRERDRHGASAGGPRRRKSAANVLSVNTSPSASVVARYAWPLGKAAHATRAGSSGRQ